MTSWFYESPVGRALHLEDDEEGYVSVSPETLLELSTGAPEGYNPLRIPTHDLLDYLEALGYRAVK